MKKPKRRMRKREKVIIFFILLFGMLGAGFELWLQTKVDDWNLQNGPEAIENAYNESPAPLA